MATTMTMLMMTMVTMMTMVMTLTMAVVNLMVLVMTMTMCMLSSVQTCISQLRLLASVGKLAEGDEVLPQHTKGQQARVENVALSC